MKKTLSIVLSLVMILSVLMAMPFTAEATALTDGICGTNATYHFVNATGELQINGSGEMYDYDMFNSPFHGRSEIKSVFISKNIESIGEYAFYDCTGITELRMGGADSLETIGAHAFDGCTGLSRVVYPSNNSGDSSINYIGEYAFANCTSLKSFIVNYYVNTVKTGTFKNCSAMRMVSLRYVSTIENAAFDGCNALTDVCYGNYLSEWNKVLIGANNSAVKNAAIHTECVGDVIGENAIYTIDWAKNMVISGTGATYDYKEVDPSTPLNSLPWSFYYVTIEEGITKVGDYLFCYCDDIDKVKFPRSLKSIGGCAFYECDDIDEVYYPGTQAQLKAITEGPTGYNKWLFNYNDWDVPFHQAYNYSGKCGDSMRYDFDTVTKTMTILGSGDMWDFEYSSKILGYTAPWANYINNITNLVINSGVTSIGDYAFLATPIVNLTTPASMKKIGTWAFAFCPSFKNITINGDNCVIAQDAFTECGGTLDSITLNGVSTVGQSAFYEVDSKELNLVGVVTIDENAFQLNETLTSVEIPETCTTVGDAAFSSCDALTSIEIFNPDCNLGVKDYTIPKDATIYGYTGSTAQTYATNNNRNFVSMGCSTHTPGEPVKVIGTPATYDKVGYCDIYVYCTVCGAELSREEDVEISKLAKTSLSKATVTGIKNKTYTGKGTTQSITVKLNGKTLKKGTDYKVSIKNWTNVGTATLTVTGINAYSGSIKKTYKINPKGTSLSNVTAVKKAFTAKWKKQTTKTTGYQIQYSTSSKFKSAKIVTVKKNKTIKTTVKKLKSKKKYYVRIRTYKTVNGKKYYSSWSKKKSIKVK